MTHVACALIVIASIAGFVNACIFTALISGWLDPADRLVASVCRLDEGDCRKVTTSKNARVLGVPNSVLGACWYVAAGICGAAGVLTGSLPFREPLLVISTFTVAVGVYLTWSLMFRLKVHCPFCYAGHLMNLILFVALALSR